jgi:hypothetical protein
MKADTIAQSQLMVAQAILALARSIDTSTGIAVEPIPFSELPAAPLAGMFQCITDSTVNTWGAVVVGGGSFSVLAWYNGTDWTVVAQ